MNYQRESHNVVVLAKVILKNPTITLADEPTASIDPETAKAIISILLALRNDKRTIIIATHDPSIWEMADEFFSIDELTSC